jgi:Tol biopolymer transport system component
MNLKDHLNTMHEKAPKLMRRKHRSFWLFTTVQAVLFLASCSTTRQTEIRKNELLIRESFLVKRAGVLLMRVSPDGKHMAYGARRGDWVLVVADGVDGKQYDGIAQNSLIFSADSKRVAYVAIRGDRQLVVVDGEEGREYDGIGENTITFGPDNKHIAYVAAYGDKQFVVVDGKEGKERISLKNHSRLYISPDLNHVAYADYTIGGKPRVVLDGAEGIEYDTIGGESIVFSPDSKHVAYVAERGNQRFVVLDGKEGKEYYGIGTASIIFSLDSKHVAYVAARGDKRFCVVVDGLEGSSEYDGIADKTPFIAFSPDSKHVAYAAIRGGRQLVVVDGVEGTEYDGIISPTFSSDSRRVAYAAIRGGKQLVVIEGKENAEYDGIGADSIIFSPDSKHVAYTAERAGKQFVVVDGKEGVEYDGLRLGHKPIIDNSGIFYAVARRDADFFRVEIEAGEG